MGQPWRHQQGFERAHHKDQRDGLLEPISGRNNHTSRAADFVVSCSETAAARGFSIHIEHRVADIGRTEGRSGVIEEMFCEVVRLGSTCLFEQGAWVVKESEVSTLQVIPVLLAGQELESLSAHLGIGVDHFIMGGDHHHRGGGHMRGAQVGAKWSRIGRNDPGRLVLPAGSMPAAVVDEPPVRLYRLQKGRTS